MPNIQLAKNLRYLRQNKKLKQKDLSDMLSISRQAYSNYETNMRTPDLDTLLYLAQFYCVDLNNLVLCDLSARSRQAAADASFVGGGPIPYTLAVNKNTGSSIYLTEEELHQLLKFRSLSPEDKQVLLGFLEHHSKKTN